MRWNCLCTLLVFALVDGGCQKRIAFLADAAVQAPNTMPDLARSSPEPLDLPHAIGRAAHELSKGTETKMIEEILKVSLAPEGKGLFGESRKWPMNVRVVGDGSSRVHRISLVIRSEAELTLGEIERVFGKHTTEVRAKQSLVGFQPSGMAGLRLRASLLDGLSTSSTVTSILMERNPVPAADSASPRKVGGRADLPCAEHRFAKLDERLLFSGDSIG